MQRGGFVALTLAGLVLMGACTTIGDDPSVPSRETDVADGDDGASPDNRGSGNASPTAAATPTPTPTATPVRKKKRRGSGSAGRGSGGQDDKPRDDAPEDPAVVASGPSASRSDPRGDGDSSGERPPYVDIRRASIGGESKTVTFGVAVEGRIPRPLPDGGMHMTASFRLDMPDGSTHNIYAIGDDGGWRAEFDGGSFPGAFSVSGNVFLWELHWRAIGGRDFRWFAQTAWTKSPSSALGETEYYFDRVPEFEAAAFPE